MEKIRLGLQTHAVREAFDADPVKTIHRIAQMGYEGVELNCWTIREDPQFYLDALKDAGLECFSCMATWEQLKRENLQGTPVQRSGDQGYDSWLGGGGAAEKRSCLSASGDYLHE